MSLLPWTTQQWFDDVGNPLQFGKIYFYQAGTLVPKVTYKKADQSETNENPVVLDISGRAKVWIIDGEAYDEVDHDENNNVIRSVQGIIVNSSSGGSGEEDHKVIVNTSDPTAGYLVDKVRNSSSVTISIVESSGRRLQFDVDEDWLASWLGINYSFPADDHLVISDGTTQTAGTLAQKLTDSLGSTFLVNGAKKLVLPLYSTLSSLTDTIPGPLGTKLKAGAGMAFNVTTDDVNGEVIHISSVDENPITAPLDEVISGDGAGGIKSSPLFKASGGAVEAETFRANSTDVAITAPNGSIEAKGVAVMDQSAWGGVGTAFFGLPGNNPPTNDGTIVGTMLSEYGMGSFVKYGGNISFSVGSGSQFGLYTSLATFLVPVFANAFSPTDCVVLTGATYTSAFHAVFAFAGTGTAFAAPAGSSLNGSLRLSNSSAVGVAITGVKTPFALAAGTSRDLVWLLDPTDMVTYRWY